MTTSSPLNISPEATQLLHSLLQTYLPHTLIWAFGSRVKGTATSYSDLDLVAFSTPDQYRQIQDLKEALEESNLPFRVDLLVWNDLPTEFQERIKQEKTVLRGLK